MSDLISRQAAIDALDEIRHALWEIDIPSPTVPEYIEHHEQIQSVWKLLDKKQKELYALPSAQPSSSCGHEKDAQSVRKRGKWRHYEGYLICSECRTEYDDDIMTHCCDDVPKFCPNCGADMRGGQNG